MSAAMNEEAIDAIVNSQHEQVRARVPPSEPLTTHGHKPGVIASERDAAPEFSAETHPPGTAPKEDTYQPAPIDSAPPTSSDAVDPDAPSASASDTLPGSTSADLHTGLGHPGQGQTSAELRHDGSRGGSKQTHGLEGVGARIDEPGLAQGSGNVSGPSAEERIPESAEAVAAEAPGGL